MNANEIRELAAGLRTLIGTADGSSHDAAIVAVCEAISFTAVEIDIEQDDESVDDYGVGGGAQYVTSTHTLTIGGETVAEWVRCAVGDYGAGSNDRSDAATWLIVEDDNVDERPDGALLTALNALGLSDSLPDVEALNAAEEDESGEYAVLFRNTADAGWSNWSCEGRYASKSDADNKCAENGRAFDSRHSNGYGPEWCVGYLDEGAWQPLDSDDD